jgi:hypothetical protein
VLSTTASPPAFLKCVCGHRFVCDPGRAKLQSRIIVALCILLIATDVAATVICATDHIFAQKGIYAGLR